jgi:CBS domain containing-hemolysin-like protein
MDIPIFLATAAVEPSLSWPEITFRLFAILFLVLLNGFFVAAEFALIAVRRTRIEQLVEEGNRAAEAVQRAQKDIDKALSASQIGITLASLALGWVGEPTISAVLRPFFQTVGFGEFLGKLPFASGEKSVEVLSIALAFFLISYMHIVLGELAPKSIAIQYAEKTALTVAQPNQVFYYLFAPFMKILNFSSNLVLRVLKVEPVLNMHHSGLSSEELQLMIAASSESGALEAGERELLSNIFEFGDVVASEVMVPRTRINSIEIDSTFQDLLAEVAATGHSRYPVYEESIDEVRGFIHIKDVLAKMATSHLDLSAPLTDLEVIRPVRFVPESKRLQELLPEMQKDRQAMVIVADEFGGTAGLLTIEDMVEEIVGSITDEGEEVLATITALDETTSVVQAQADLEEVNEQLKLNLPTSDEYQTLGGFLIYHLQKIPEEGEKFLFEGIEFAVLEVNGPRLEKIKVSILLDPAKQDDLTSTISKE